MVARDAAFGVPSIGPIIFILAQYLLDFAVPSKAHAREIRFECRFSGSFRD